MYKSISKYSILDSIKDGANVIAFDRETGKCVSVNQMTVAEYAAFAENDENIDSRYDFYAEPKLP